MSEREPAVYVDDILSSIRKIKRYTKGMSEAEFFRSSITVDAVVRNLGIIGEAASAIPDEYKKKFSNVPWRKIIGMRNKVVHEYFGLIEDILWSTINKDIPLLERQIKEVAKKLKKSR